MPRTFLISSLPPLIAQAEFAKEDVSRVVSLNVAISQGTYAFAPAAFGLIREFAPQAGVVAMIAQEDVEAFWVIHFDSSSGKVLASVD